ncbi:ABC transporter ATP-binding protein [Nitrospira moscoviensis]|uniref:ABC transporter ATP-binding protein n=1 Tax=Nitrospira moscoviensis TaxID=42253 RepID=UPI0006A79A2A|nr:ABC transporter ATP-binding protein [Nitrospira moscoviensis]
MPAAIVTSDLTKRFPGVTAVDRLTFEVHAGEIFGLVGPDGAGKTTTLRILAGVLTPDAGSATVAGYDIVHDPEAAKAHVSYMPQRFGLYEDLTVEENIRFYADLFGVARSEREPRAHRLLDGAGMSPFTNRLAGKLSGGMKQKLGLVCALIHHPRVILLDEPTNGVDPVSRRDFWRILYSLLDEGIAILMSTSYLDEAERCHRVALVHQGRMLFSDTPAGLKTHLRGAVVSIDAPDPRRIRAELDGAAGVLNALLVGDGVHLVVDDAERRIPELRAVLQRAGMAFDRVEEVTPTIEDLFVAATGESHE